MANLDGEEEDRVTGGITDHPSGRAGGGDEGPALSCGASWAMIAKDHNNSRKSQDDLYLTDTKRSKTENKTPKKLNMIWRELSEVCWCP